MENILHLYHYYDITVGAFVNLSDISIEEANNILGTSKNIITIHYFILIKIKRNYVILLLHENNIILNFLLNNRNYITAINHILCSCFHYICISL